MSYDRSWIYATDSQVKYLRALMAQAFARGVKTGYVVNDWSRLLKGEAGKMIGEIKAKLEEASNDN